MSYVEGSVAFTVFLEELGEVLVYVGKMCQE